MEYWLKISLLLCVFAFVKEIRPSECFFYEYLTDKRWQQVTEEKLTHLVFPIGIYSNMLLAIVMFLITDMCRYKPLIIISSIIACSIWIMRIWGSTFLDLQITEALYGALSATEVAFNTYIYAKVDRKHYQKVTSNSRGAFLAGRTFSGILAQVLVSLHLLDLRQLNCISLAGSSIATIWSLLLPPVDKSLYFHSEDTKDSNFTQKVSSAFKLMKSHFVDAYTNFHVVKWSLWWALSACGYLQIEYYQQTLFSTIPSKLETSYNGAIMATITLLGSIGALSTGYVPFNWKSKGELVLALFSLIQGVVLVVASKTENIFVCYGCYICFGVLYHTMLTVASAQVAQEIDEDSYGLVFGINMFFSLVCSSVLTLLVSTKGVAFALGVKEQYVVYGGYHLVIGAVYVVLGVRTYWVTALQSDKKQSREIVA